VSQAVLHSMDKQQWLNAVCQLFCYCVFCIKLNYFLFLLLMFLPQVKLGAPCAFSLLLFIIWSVFIVLQFIWISTVSLDLPWFDNVVHLFNCLGLNLCKVGSKTSNICCCLPRLLSTYAICLEHSLCSKAVKHQQTLRQLDVTTDFVVVNSRPLRYTTYELWWLSEG